MAEFDPYRLSTSVRPRFQPPPIPTYAQPPAAPATAAPATPGIPNPTSGYNPTTDTATGKTRQILQTGFDTGSFGPDFIARRARDVALRNWVARRRRMSVLSHVLGLDPMQSRVAYLDSENRGATDFGNEATGAATQGLGHYQDLLFQLLGGQAGNEYQKMLADQQSKDARRAGWGQLAGGLASAIF